MSNVGQKAQDGLVAMMKHIILKAPPIQDLDLESAGFDSEAGEEICKALAHANITTLTFISLIYNASWLDSDEKCGAWAQVFKSQTNLTELELYGCEVSSSGQAIIKAACSKAKFSLL